MKKVLFPVVSSLLLLFVNPAMSQIIVNEDFESYASDADLISAWSGGAGTLDTANGFNSSQSAFHPAGTVNSFAAGIGVANATTTHDLVLTGRIYDDAVAGNDRVTIGMRGGPFPLFEMGRYNSYDSPTTGEFDVYGVRINTIGNGIPTPGDFTPSNGWVAFPDSIGDAFPSTEGWHTYEATFSLSGITIELDLLSDGTIDSTLNYAGDESGYAGGFTDLRFGGPSNLASAGGGANFDDIRLELVAVGGGGGLACDLDADMDCDQDDIDILYQSNPIPTTSDIDVWLAAASDPLNQALGNSTDTLVMGDVDLSGEVDSVDLGLLLNNFNSTTNLRWRDGNLNADGMVDSGDLGLLLNNFGFVSLAAVSVPEPSGMLLGILAFFGMVSYVRRR